MSSETSVLTRITRRNTPEDGILNNTLLPVIRQFFRISNRLMACVD
jgi:hypothetical protein